MDFEQWIRTPDESAASAERGDNGGYYLMS